MQLPTLAEYSQKYDHIKFEREDGIRIDRVQRAALDRRQGHGGVDLAARLLHQLQGRPSDDGPHCRLWRKVTFVCDSNDLVAQSECEKSFRGAREKGDDPHSAGLSV